jgi:hypothetical protein
MSIDIRGLSRQEMDEMFDNGYNVEHLLACIDALMKPTKEEQIEALEKIARVRNVARHLLTEITGIMICL